MSQESPELVARVTALESQVNNLISNLGQNNYAVVELLKEWVRLMSENGEKVKGLNENLIKALGDRDPPGCKKGS